MQQVKEGVKIIVHAGRVYWTGTYPDKKGEDTTAAAGAERSGNDRVCVAGGLPTARYSPW